MSLVREKVLHNVETATVSDASLAGNAVIVVGAGPTGQRVAKDILRYDPDCKVTIFGDEPYEPYDRIQLSSYLAGDTAQPWIAPGDDTRDSLTTQLGHRITRVVRKTRCVYDGEGNAWQYSKLVLATGSHAFIPPIHGAELRNVFSFRNMSDAELLKARTISSRHTVVIGGGLLGLEAARAMRRFNTKVTVIEQSAWLMFQQLDEEAGALLGSQIKNNGITVRTGVRVQSIKGSDRVESIVLTGNEVIDCDTVVMATGIQSNMELARDAKLNVRMGILVNDRMQTNDPNIYAVGECAEYQGKVYGLVKPCLEQAAVAASVITGGQARYAGSELVTQLKVIDSPVFSIGETSTEWNRREVIYRDNDRGLLRKLFLIGNRLDAALAIGGWPEFARLQEAVTKNRRVWPWQLARFAESGSLWPVDEEAGILSWPASATVCNCMGVTRGALSHEISKGCRDVRSLAEHTGASTVCGTCRPLLQQMIGIIGMEPVRASRLLSIAGGITLVAVLVLLVIPGMTYRDSVQSIWHWDILWRDNLFKQISGFSLLGLSTFLAFISLPKRIRSKFRWGDFSSWRAAHVVVGAGTLLVLLAHTGFRLGHELNMLLMLTFSSLLLAGGLLSASIGLQHRIPLALARTTRNWSLWAHVVLLWPLPALLGFHVLKTYWY